MFVGGYRLPGPLFACTALLAGCAVGDTAWPYEGPSLKHVAASLTVIYPRPR